MLKTHVISVVKPSILYGILAFGFSFIGIFLPSSYVVGNPLEVSGVTPEHILGHILWGLAIGAITLRYRYLVVAGLFPLILDSDHLLQFFDLEMIPRLAHSFIFGLISIGALMFVINKKDLILGMIGFAAVLAHMSFDIFYGGGSKFPFLAPFSSELLVFGEQYWIFFELLAISIVGVSILVQRKFGKQTVDIQNKLPKNVNLN